MTPATLAPNLARQSRPDPVAAGRRSDHRRRRINSAHATPASPGQLYADEHAAEVCSALDIRPTVPGVINVLITLETAGLSTHESGVAIAESVVFVCPIHANLLRQFVAHYKTDRSVAA
ncbi:hypothetical protein [Mycolicibacter algericus]|uniref:DUF732 domain-containing protein n=1 Tax=Mycolicibacter algericus TaxID=1288388 RepID=A0A7I9YGT0_MYCAL|nr:hypothetical protein [Mycolicibacter algericus]GFG87891.1 hypothetical protein MALGJ_45670 [Mycolicibacter algericus]